MRAPSTAPPAAVRAEAPTPSAPISSSTSAPVPVAASPDPEVATSTGGRAHLRVVFNPKATDPVWRARGASGGLGSGTADVPVGKVTLSWRIGTGEWEAASTTTVDVPAGGGSFVCRGSGASARCVPQ